MGKIKSQEAMYVHPMNREGVMLRFIDLFSGIGGFRRGLERSGHRCAGHVEIDSYANRSYMAMYGYSHAGMAGRKETGDS